MSLKKLSVLLGVLVVVSMILTACPAPQPQVVEKVVTQVVKEEVKVVETQVVEKQVEVEKVVTKEVEKVVEKAAEDFTTPHPILSDIKVRQAIAHCINRDELIASVYPFRRTSEKAKLRMDTCLPKTHWAYSGPYTDYAFERGEGRRAAGRGRLEAARRRHLPHQRDGRHAGAEVHDHHRAVPPDLGRRGRAEPGRLRHPDHPPARARVLVVRRHDRPGPPRLRAGRLRLGRRVRSQGPHPLRLRPDPAPQQQLGRPELHGLVQQDRQRRDRRGQQHPDPRRAHQGATTSCQKEFAKDMVSLPLFQRVEAEAWSKNLEGIKTSTRPSTRTASAKDWKLTDGGDTVVIGFSQEPASMFTPGRVGRRAAPGRPIWASASCNTQFNYDYQPALQDPLSTVESGLATNDGRRRQGRRHGLRPRPASRSSWRRASRSSTRTATRSSTTAPARSR